MGNQKKEAIDLIERLPDKVNTADIIDELYFKMQVDEGLRDVAERRTLSHDEMKERLFQWRSSGGR